ncbi:MAG: 2-oxoacid:acceptor oxidoreductase family protein [Fimbriimonadales bacterium]|nr:2-oxoacid:acceptor oxidoreductase family protein [Fimbriimonadales bacterium]
MKFEVRLSGEGGQGLILAGKILAEAAAIHAGLNATQSQSYGPEARGGASRSEVILSDGEIDYPKATEVDVMVALTQQSYDTYRHDVKKGGVVIVDSEAVESLGDTWYRVVSHPIFQLSEQHFGRILFGNMIALGLVAGVTGVLPKDAVEAALVSRVPKGTEEKNLAAFRLGYGLAEADAAGKGS